MRTDRVSDMISRREGFHDHLNAGSVWGVVDLDRLNCIQIKELINQYPELKAITPIDDEAKIDKKIKRSIHNVYTSERSKVIRWCTIKELIFEIKRRLTRRTLQLARRYMLIH